jgi:hypothetical protein
MAPSADMLDDLARMGLAVSFATALASVARSLIRHSTECRRLEIVEHLVDRHGADAVSALSELIPPEPTTNPPLAHTARRSPAK